MYQYESFLAHFQTVSHRANGIYHQKNPKKCFSLETCTSSVMCRFRRLEVLARDNPAEYGAFCSNIQFPVKNEFSLIFFSPISRKRIFVPWLSCNTSYFPFFYSVNPTEDYYLKQTGTPYIRRAKNETQTEKEYHRMNMMVFTNSTTTSIETCAKDRQRVNGTKFFPLKKPCLHTALLLIHSLIHSEIV